VLHRPPRTGLSGPFVRRILVKFESSSLTISPGLQLMKFFYSLALAFSFSCISFAGSYGSFELNCVSESFRTHVYMRLNDYDFVGQALYPQVIILSVVGHMFIFDEEENYGFRFETAINGNLLNIFSTDKERSYSFRVDFSKKSTAKAVIDNAINPRTNRAFSGLVLECQKSHDL
jgi:hypothetical protein